MNVKRFINYNGNRVLSTDPVFHCNNRGFLYGDALFETMVSFNGIIPFLNDHIDRLKSGMELLEMRIPLQFSNDFFKDEIGSLLRKNKFFKGVRIRLNIFRNEGGLYTPSNNNVSYLIDSSVLSDDHFVLNPEGYKIDAFTEHLKPLNFLSSIKSTNALLFVKAGIYKKKNELDECIILNTEKYICETLSSNIFLVKNNIIYTPSVSSGCLPGVMRKNIIKLAKNKGIELQEVHNITVDHILQADECFITNAINGIRWISSFLKERYQNKMAVYLTSELNKLIN